MILIAKKILQLLFLAAFLFLIVAGRMQVWMLVFLGSTAAAALFSRFYCGWICPINTLMDGVNWIGKRLGLKRRAVPSWMKNPLLRYGILLLFLAVMVFTAVTGRKVPLLIALTVLALGLSLFLEPLAWHRYLCPYGALLGLTGRFSRLHLRINTERCIQCGRCASVCQGGAVDGSDGDPVIRPEYCLDCLECAKNCPQDAIHFTGDSGKLSSIST